MKYKIITVLVVMLMVSPGCLGGNQTENIDNTQDNTDTSDGPSSSDYWTPLDFDEPARYVLYGWRNR